MKIFFTTFIIVFTLFMSCYYLYTYEEQTYVSEGVNTSAPLSDDLNRPNKKPDLADNKAEIDNRATKPDTIATSSVATVPAIVNRLFEPRRFSVPKIKDTESAEQLYERNYIFTHESFLDAIAANDVVGVSLFLKAGMKLEFACKYHFEIPEGSRFFYYTEDGAVLYNPVSLAIVANSNNVLPLLLEFGGNLKLLNDLTCAHQKEPHRKAYCDLFAFSLRGKDINLLRMLLKAGFKLESQVYLAVTLSGPTKKAKEEELTTEEHRRRFNAMADIMVELINNGQSIEQSIPIRSGLWPSIKPINFVLGTGNKKFREEFIARINDPESRIKLTEFIGRLKKSRPPQAESY